MKLYATRDIDKALVLCNKKLKKYDTRWDCPPSKRYEYINLPNSWLPDVKWSDDAPTKVTIGQT